MLFAICTIFSVARNAWNALCTLNSSAQLSVRFISFDRFTYHTMTLSYSRFYSFVQQFCVLFFLSPFLFFLLSFVALCSSAAFLSQLQWSRSFISHFSICYFVLTFFLPVVSIVRYFFLLRFSHSICILYIYFHGVKNIFLRAVIMNAGCRYNVAPANAKSNESGMAEQEKKANHWRSFSINPWKIYICIKNSYKLYKFTHKCTIEITIILLLWQWFDNGTQKAEPTKKNMKDMKETDEQTRANQRAHHISIILSILFTFQVHTHSHLTWKSVTNVELWRNQLLISGSLLLLLLDLLLLNKISWKMW